jgi:hypothetical protein
MQLPRFRLNIHAGADDSNMNLQFGRVTQDTFSLDGFYPLSPLESFAVALTTFDAFENA